MLSFDVATTPPAAGRARIPDTAVGDEPLNRREYSGTPIKLDAFNNPGISAAEGPRDGVENGLGFEARFEANGACASEDGHESDQAEATSIILPATETSSSFLSAWRSCSSS